MINTNRAHGVDISKYDLQFKPETATEKLDFVIQRASWRITRDEAFDTLVPGVMAMPIRGAYHYLSSSVPWREQADAFLSYIQPYEYHFLVCDFESSFNVLSVDFAYAAWQWIWHVAAQKSLPVMLYTNLSTYNNYVQPSEARFGIDWDRVPYWQAQYFFIADPNGNPVMPTGRTAGWKFWQYTPKALGTLFGLGRSTAGDLDVYNGGVSDLRQWANIATSPTVNPRASIQFTDDEGRVFEANDVELKPK